MIDEQGYRHGVGIVLINDDGEVFLAKRIGQQAWQFPQGGLLEGEEHEQALFRELNEETGLLQEHVDVLMQTKSLLAYDLPERFIRKRSTPLVIGQRQRWFLLKLKPQCEQNFQLDHSDAPEFDDWRWAHHEEALQEVVDFKHHVYQQLLDEFQELINEVKLNKAC